ncbi:MAG: glycosyltransferase family 4 protein [Acidimicrobiia bacterium]|nr:glycosyltransferase family 4 protein [Acidimicrobiia bacterium]
MKVLIVAQQLRRRVPGGIGTYVRGLTMGLRALDGGRDVTLWASAVRGGAGRGGDDDPLASLGRVRTSSLPAPLLTRAWDVGFAGAPPGFDVLHATSLAVPPPRGTPATVLVHDVAFRHVPEAYPRRGRRWHEAALRRAIRRARLLAVPSAETAEDLLAAGAPTERVRVLTDPYGCDHLPPADAAATSGLLARLGVDGEYLLTVSTLEPRKNLQRLVAAYRAARPRLPEPWPLVVVGPSGWGHELAPEAGVVLAGPVPGAALAGLYGRARLVAYVPLLEGFGLPAVEAMYACAPVVASPMPSTGGAAFEVDPRDVDAIADALVAVAGQEGVRSQLVTAGVLRSSELTWEAAARRHVELWSEVVGS